MRRELSIMGLSVGLSLVLYAVALVLGSLVICHMSYASEIPGNWATRGNVAHVRIERCATVQDKLCGIVTWLWEPVDGNGEPTRDAKNPDLRLRDRPVIGLSLLTNFHYVGSGESIDGQIYNPENGRTYRASLRVRGSDMLEVKGCLLFVCDIQVWRRVESLCRSAVPNVHHEVTGEEDQQGRYQ